ncbi:MAG: hypothetical protein GEV10_24065 [Streptosporangiales bacterium]|nr:hypothetical protein [Streptosporangiales bacterium]
MKRHLVRAGLAVAALTAVTGLAWAGAPPASAEPECLNQSNDFDQDGGVDVAVGMPGADLSTGAVEVRVSDGEGSTVHRIEAPDAQRGDEFGFAVAEVAASGGEADQDRCSMLVVGAPGRDVGGAANAGAVFLYRWDAGAAGFALVGEYSMATDGVPGQAQAFARFGHALAAPYHEGGEIGGLVTPLYVGVPRYSVGSAHWSGAFTRLTFTLDEDPAVDEGTLVTQDSAGIPDTAEQDDQLGDALAAVDGGVLVGAPGEQVGTVDWAGGFLRWREGDSGQARFVTQDTPGVPGVPETGDEFGRAIYAAHELKASGGGHFVMVGAPGESIGDVLRAGSAIRFVYDGELQVAGAQGFNQDTTGVAGRPEQDDAFGSAFGSYGPTRTLVGVPGESVGTVGNAGLVQGLSGERSWQQDTAGVPGSVGIRHRFGATIGNALYGLGGSGEDGWLGDVLVGVPGDDRFVGSVVAGLPGGPGGSERWTPQTPGDEDAYGSAVGRTN